MAEQAPSTPLPPSTPSPSLSPSPFPPGPRQYLGLPAGLPWALPWQPQVALPGPSPTSRVPRTCY